MSTQLDNTLQQQIIAALVNSPDGYAPRAIQRLEPADFPHPHYALIFTTLSGLKFPRHPEPGSIMVQLNNALLEGGHYTGQDNGLRALVNGLVGITGHPQKLPEFTTTLITERWRAAVATFGENLTEHAKNSPEHDVVGALRGMDEVRRLYTRIQSGGES